MSLPVVVLCLHNAIISCWRVNFYENSLSLCSLLKHCLCKQLSLWKSCYLLIVQNHCSVANRRIGHSLLYSFISCIIVKLKFKGQKIQGICPICGHIVSWIKVIEFIWQGVHREKQDQKISDRKLKMHSHSCILVLFLTRWPDQGFLVSQSKQSPTSKRPYCQD